MNEELLVDFIERLVRLEIAAQQLSSAIQVLQKKEVAK